MSERVQNQYEPDYVSPPGETLMATLESLGMSQAELAERTGRAKKTINEIIKGKASITPSIALEFERVLRVPAGFWNNRERFYRESLARRHEQARLEERIEWLKTIPVKAMVQRGWIGLFNDKVHQLRELLNFFGIASPDQWEELAVALGAQIAFRKSTVFESDKGALLAWLRKGELEGQAIQCDPYDANKFKMALQKMRTLSRGDPNRFFDEAKCLCAAGGVAVVFVPELPKSRVSGATRWLNSRKALIQLSLRYKTDDHFWFTFFHEAAHILLHAKKLIFLEGSAHAGQTEEEADRFAAGHLIPDSEFRRLKQCTRFTKPQIEEFASEIGIAPGIVVGRLQHEGMLPMDHCNDLKIRFEWAKE